MVWGGSLIPCPGTAAICSILAFECMLTKEKSIVSVEWAWWSEYGESDVLKPKDSTRFFSSQTSLSRGPGGRLRTVRREHGGPRNPELQPLGPAPGPDLAGVRPARRRHPGGEEEPGLPVSAEGGQLGAGLASARVSGRFRMAEH